jgi:hypothetical protein
MKASLRTKSIWAASVAIVVIVWIAVWPTVQPFVDLGRSLIYRRTRMNEKLPTITIQKGSAVYCRMQLCDFRFPLPQDSQVVSSQLLRGGDDAVTGVICVTNSEGRPVDLNAYHALLNRHGFQNRSYDPYSDVADAVEQQINTTNQANGHIVAWIVENDDCGTIAV